MDVGRKLSSWDSSRLLQSWHHPSRHTPLTWKLKIVKMFHTLKNHFNNSDFDLSTESSRDTFKWNLYLFDRLGQVVWWTSIWQISHSHFDPRWNLGLLKLQTNISTHQKKAPLCAHSPFFTEYQSTCFLVVVIFLKMFCWTPQLVILYKDGSADPAPHDHPQSCMVRVTGPVWKWYKMSMSAWASAWVWLPLRYKKKSQKWTQLGWHLKRQNRVINSSAQTSVDSAHILTEEPKPVCYEGKKNNTQSKMSCHHCGLINKCQSE